MFEQLRIKWRIRQSEQLPRKIIVAQKYGNYKRVAKLNAKFDKAMKIVHGIREEEELRNDLAQLRPRRDDWLRDSRDDNL